MRRISTMVIASAFAASAAVAAPTAQAPTPATAIVQLQVDAFNAGDTARFASFYADDIEMFELGPDPKPNLSGQAALLERYKPMLEKYHPRAIILSRIEAENFVIDKERTEAGGRSSEGVAIYEVENGKIRRVWFTP